MGGGECRLQCSAIGPTAHQSARDAGDDAPPGETVRDYTVRAVDRVCAILNLLQTSIDGVTLGDVGEATSLPKSSAFRYLWTLEQHRYVERDDASGLYRLGLGFVAMQSRQLEVLRQRAGPVLERLRDEVGETVNLGVLDRDCVVYVDIADSRRGVRLSVRRGDREPLHSTALGKAITSAMTDEEVTAIVARTGMPPMTARTITSVTTLLDEIAGVRRLGYAVDDGENEIDGRCVAVPILGTRIPAALSISAPAARLPMQAVDGAAAALIAAAAEIAGPVA